MRRSAAVPGNQPFGDGVSIRPDPEKLSCQMHLLFEILTDGFVIGAIYALGAAGFTIIFGVSGVLNLAHGSIMVIGAMVAWYCALQLHLGIYAGSIIGILASIATSYLLYFLVVRPLDKSKRVREEERPVFIFTATLLAAIIVQGALDFFFGSSPVTPPALVKGVTTLSGIKIPDNEILILAIAWVVIGVLWLFITRTRAGKAMAAASMNRTGLAIVGYDIGRIYFLVWGIYGFLAGLAGVLLASFLGASSEVGIGLTASAFTIVVLGGLGNVPGSLVAAYIIGFLGTITAYEISPAIREYPGLILLIIILYIRPRGLFGRQ